MWLSRVYHVLEPDLAALGIEHTISGRLQEQIVLLLTMATRIARDVHALAPASAGSTVEIHFPVKESLMTCWIWHVACR